MTGMDNASLKTHVEKLVHNLEKMQAPYEAHVHAKKCVEYFWGSIQPVVAPGVPERDGETGKRETDATA